MLTTTVTFEGNLAADPECASPPHRKQLAELRVLVNARRQNDAGEWEDTEPTRHRVTSSALSPRTSPRACAAATGCSSSAGSPPTPGPTRTPATSAPHRASWPTPSGPACAGPPPDPPAPASRYGNDAD